MKATGSGDARCGTRADIAFIIFGLGCGGAEFALLELVRGLDRSRFRPIVISLAPRAALSNAFEEAAVEVHYLGLRRFEQAPLVFIRAWKLVRRLKPSLLHGVMFYGDVVARLIRMLEGTRVVSALHNTYIGPREFEQVLHWSDRYTDAVTAVSNAVADAQVGAGSVPSDKVRVIYNGIDLNRIAQPSQVELASHRARLGLSPSDRVLLCVARLEPAKEHALLLRAFKTVATRFDDVKLVLVGPGRLEGKLRDQAAALGISRQVCFAGQVDPVAPMFYLGELFVLSSSHEGLPLVVLEAMAARLPIVLTAVGGVPEVIEHEVNGILVAPFDEAGLVEGLERVLRMTPEARARMGQAARATVEQRFSAQHMVSATQDLYEELLAQAHRKAQLTRKTEVGSSLVD